MEFERFRHDAGPGGFQVGWTILLVLMVGLVSACGGNGAAPGTAPADDSGRRLSLAVPAPENFDAPFCVRIQVLAPGLTPAVHDSMHPARTALIETVVPNLEPGDGRVVEMGIFRDGVCADMDSASWFGRAADVQVRPDQVTLVDLGLIRQGGGGTGTIIVRGDQARTTMWLHGEVVAALGTANPAGSTEPLLLGGAGCRIFEGNELLASVVSDTQADALGVLNTQVSVRPGTTELTLNCRLAGFRDQSALARLVPQAANPADGTFAATVVMRRGARVTVLDSTTAGLSFEVGIPAVRTRSVQTAFGNFDRIDNADNGFDLTGGGGENESQPEVPVMTTYVAVPIGTQPTGVSVEMDSDGQTVAARLYPIQPPRRDAAGANPGDPFVRDDEAFVFNEDVYRGSPVDIRKNLKFEPVDDGGGDLNLFRLQVPLVDFDPAQQVMTTHSSMRINVQFSGDCFRRVRTAANFQMDAVDQHIEDQPPALARNILNRELVLKHICELPIRPVFLGARLVIVTPPHLRPAADTLRTHKIARGISTAIIDTSTLGTTAPTKSQIRNALSNAYNNWFVRPRWVLFMGDAEYIPTSYDLTNSWDSARNAGDLYYGQLLGGALSQSVFGLGRIPVDTLDQANAVVDKIIAFENSPPSNVGLLFDNPYYSSTSFAAQFQDVDPTDGQAERWFAETSERIRSHLVGQSINVERIYRAPAASNPTLYQGGNPVPLSLRKPAFAWDGDTTDIINAFNDGRSIIYHRDHGWWWGWGTPGFSQSDFGSISVTNNEFPIVYSINCASGIFDNETVDLPANIVGGGYGPNVGSSYFAERLLRKSDGAVAIIGDTRSSSTVLNNDLAEGLFDATWPAHLPFGGATPIRRLGDVLNHAKAYVSSRGYSATATRQEIHIYNVIGDPTLEVPTRPARSVTIGGFVAAASEIEILLGCPQCTRELAPINVVVQDRAGEVLARGMIDPARDGVAENNGLSFVLKLALDSDAAEAVVTFSGADIATLQRAAKLASPIQAIRTSRLDTFQP